MTATIKINGVDVAMPRDAVGYKYADPIEDARWIYDIREIDDLITEGGRRLVVLPEEGE